MNHLRRIDDPVELVFRHVSQLQCGLLECQVVVEGVVSNLRRLVITNDRSKSGNQHQGAINMLLDLLQVWLCPFDKKLSEVCASVSHDRDGVSNIEDDQR